MNFKDVPQFPFASYRCNIGWDYLESWIKSNSDSPELYTLELDPEYQRGYIWTFEQKIAYLEYRLRGGFSGKDVFWNCPNWQTGRKFPQKAKLELVDGKQRIEAVRGFLRDEIKAFGLLYSEFEGSLSFEPDFIFHINNMTNRYDVVKWYIDMNTGGSIHTETDLAPAYALLEKLKINPA